MPCWTRPPHCSLLVRSCRYLVVALIVKDEFAHRALARKDVRIVVSPGKGFHHYPFRNSPADRPGIGKVVAPTSYGEVSDDCAAQDRASKRVLCIPSSVREGKATEVFADQLVAAEEPLWPTAFLPF